MIHRWAWESDLPALARPCRCLRDWPIQGYLLLVQASCSDARAGFVYQSLSSIRYIRLANPRQGCESLLPQSQVRAPPPQTNPPNDLTLGLILPRSRHLNTINRIYDTARSLCIYSAYYLFLRLEFRHSATFTFALVGPVTNCVVYLPTSALRPRINETFNH